MKLPQFPPKPFPPLFPEMDISIPQFPTPKSLTVGIPPQLQITFDIEGKK